MLHFVMSYMKQNNKYANSLESELRNGNHLLSIFHSCFQVNV